MLGERVFTLGLNAACTGPFAGQARSHRFTTESDGNEHLWERACPAKGPALTATFQPFSAGAELSSNGLLLRRWLRSSRGVAPKKLR